MIVKNDQIASTLLLLLKSMSTLQDICNGESIFTPAGESCRKQTNKQ